MFENARLDFSGEEIFSLVETICIAITNNMFDYIYCNYESYTINHEEDEIGRI